MGHADSFILANFFLTGTFVIFGLTPAKSNRFQNGFLQKFVGTHADTLAWPDFLIFLQPTDNIRNCRFFLHFCLLIFSSRYFQLKVQDS